MATAASESAPTAARRGPSPRWLAVLLVLSAELLPAQTSRGTVRHHRVAEVDPSSSPEVQQAEAAIEKKDFAAAQPLLEKAVSANPSSYVAWFDLGFVYNALGDSEKSIAAYRKSVAAKEIGRAHV